MSVKGLQENQKTIVLKKKNKPSLLNKFQKACHVHSISMARNGQMQYLVDDSSVEIMPSQ